MYQIIEANTTNIANISIGKSYMSSGGGIDALAPTLGAYDILGWALPFHRQRALSLRRRKNVAASSLTGWFADKCLTFFQDQRISS